MKRYRRLHGSQTEELHHMVGNHVAQGASVVEVSATSFHPHGFSIRDLDMIDVTAIPKRLEDRVVEPEHHNVLHCLLPEIMINAVNLILVQHTLDIALHALGRFNLVSVWFLDDNAPAAHLFLSKKD